ncbi:MAG: M4 family metallopeptidase [Flavobacteriaceae bacterium]|nr:M4 family metallopeptidase [Flavobacteriaceae bacterium]
MQRTKRFLMFLLCFGTFFYGDAQNSRIQKKTVSKDGNASIVVFQKSDSYTVGEVQNFFAEELQLGNNMELRQVDLTTDQLSFDHYTYQQYYNGIKVEHGIYKIHARDNQLQVANGEHFKVELASTSTSLSAEAALRTLLSRIGAKSYVWEHPEAAAEMDYERPEGELVVLPVKQSGSDNYEYFLTYKFDIFSNDPLDRAHYFVNARTGVVVAKEQIMCTAPAETMYSGDRNIETQAVIGSGFTLVDVTRGSGIRTRNNQGAEFFDLSGAVMFIDNDDNWTAAEWNNANQDQAALDAHWGLEMTYDYFSNVHGRDSYDGNGALIDAYAHVSFFGSPNNAAWTGNNIVFGDGDGFNFSPLTSLDVCAHEMAHAVDQFSSNLTYQDESGALDEGLADIWGACAESLYAPEKSRWLIGEEITLFQYALRDMSNPNALNLPDTYHGNFWFFGSGDNGGVHTNSSVLNHWFYLLTEGSGATDGVNDNGDVFNVVGIGIQDAEQITYRMETVYLTASSNYADAREYGIQSAIDLFGECSQQHISTQNAFYAVGIGEEFTDCCPFIDMVRLWDDSYQNPSGESADNYTDYTQEACIPIFETDAPQINIEPSSDGVFIAMFIDLNGDGDFCDTDEEMFNDFVASGSVGVSFTDLINNNDIVGDEIVRAVVSDSPITCNEIPVCGEAEDYRLCPPCDGGTDGCMDFNCEDYTGLMGTSCDAQCYHNLLDGWGGSNIDGVAYRNDDSIDGPDDYYLFIDDGGCSSAGSFVFNHDDFAGDWTERGKCICFDLNAFHVGSTISGSSSLRIGNGIDNCTSNITATFVLDDPINVADGWVNICAPIGLSDAGELPSNDVGHWVINTGSTTDWDALIQNVQSLLFYVDVDSGNEQWGLDNICFDPCIDCEDVNSADFTVVQECSSEGVTISVQDFELYTDFGATHEWYILSSPNQGAGPYTPVTSTTTTGPGPHVLATGLPDTLYYTVFHKVVTEDCGEICFAREVWCTGLKTASRFAPVDCCLIFEHWPNGPGEPIEFTAEFNHEITLDNTINAVPLYEYENNSSVVHEWYLYSRDELNAGDFTFVTMQTGVNFSWGPAQEGVYYFLLHKVISDCGEVCYMRAIYKSRFAGEECEICGPIDCSFIDNPNPECETTQPINVQYVEGFLTWDPVPDAQGYIVENAQVWPTDCRCDAPSSIVPFQTMDTSVPIPLGDGRCYVLQVRAICADGSVSLPSDLICVGGRKLKKLIATVTPNPTHGEMVFNVETDEASPVTIEVYNFYGELVRSFATQTTNDEVGSVSWEGPVLRKGVYFVKFITNEGIATKRVIVH